MTLLLQNKERSQWDKAIVIEVTRGISIAFKSQEAGRCEASEPIHPLLTGLVQYLIWLSPRREFHIGESSRVSTYHKELIWDVNHLRKNGGKIFLERVDLKVAIKWLNNIGAF